jgi:aminoglycoside phosphotransferase family enzyme/predicted kinase
MSRIVDETEQAAIVAALESGAATGDSQPLQRLDTHMSRVFVGPDQVYKLKRARRHPYIDLSSPEQRHVACDAELAVNRPLAPDLYEAVRAVTRDADGALSLDGPGEIVDWLVTMKRIPPGDILDEMTDAGRLTPALVRELAETVARFHGSLAPVTDAGRPADYGRIIDGLQVAEAEGAAALGVRRTASPLFDRLRAELSRQSATIDARRRAGWVRRGHGDLHLRNICVFNGRVTPFDALEFDPALALGDTLYDLAFLLMDLEARGLRVQANLAMNLYWDASGQPEAALALLPFFTALRACVRMAVAVEAGSLDEADRYQALALRLLRPRRPRLLAIGGLSGCGKSALAAAIAPRLPGPCGGRLLRSDVVRKQLAGVETARRLEASAYDPVARAGIYRHLAQRSREALAAGAAVVADATFREDEARSAIEGAAQGYPFAALWLRADTSVRIARIVARTGDPSDITAEIAAVQTEPAGLTDGWRVLDANGAETAVVAAAARRIATAGFWIKPPAAPQVSRT